MESRASGPPCPAPDRPLGPAHSLSSHTSSSAREFGKDKVDYTTDRAPSPGPSQGTASVLFFALRPRGQVFLQRTRVFLASALIGVLVPLPTHMQPDRRARHIKIFA